MVGLIAGFLIVPVGVAQADATVAIEKSVVGNHTTVEPGDTFSYLIKVSCLSLQDPCLDMTVTDPIPSPTIPASSCRRGRATLVGTSPSVVLPVLRYS